MKNINRIIILAVLFAFLAAGNPLRAERLKGERKTSSSKANATCLPANNSNELVVNNVRAYIETGGTMWFKEIAEYEIPRGSGQTSMFCAALWIGGRDVNQQLKLAAVRFRQEGDDFWTGPLSRVDASVSQETCSRYDRFFKITRAEVENHIAAFQGGVRDPEYVMPAIFSQWPAHGDVSLGQSYYLAPFKDVDNDGEYNPENGDYPYYDLDNELCPWTEENIWAAQNDELPKTPEENWSATAGGRPTTGMIYADHVLKGDETLFWIFNDKGGPHTESKGEAIGLEIRGQAFAFATNDDLNNMTFYSYEIINRSTFELTNTYFSQWVDPDLGFANDDYVGCDVARGLGYCYNGYDVDGSGQIWAYGNQPPAVGVDFFQGPYIDPDGRDNPRFYPDSADQAYCARYLDSQFPVDQMAINGVNFGDGIVDNERFGMRRFVYHNNDRSVTGDPSVAFEYYNMLQGIWKDNTKMKYGGNAHASNGGNGPDCDFMFPGLTDVCNWGTQGVNPNPAQYGNGGWTEANVGNAPYDRRFMQSAGPFTLRPGAVNYITVGIPWARASQGGAWASVELLKIADDKCQALFENCFKVLDGPDAPDVTIREMENELVLYLTNEDRLSNNYNESYQEFDNQITEFTEELIERTRIDSVLGIDSVWHFFEVRDDTIVKRENDRYYHFEGYMIYQLRNKDVSVTDLNDPDKAKLVAQCDIRNDHAQLVNYIYNESIQRAVPTEMVNGANNGIFHSISLKEDAFATSAKQLVNHRTYYYMVLAYAVNQYLPFDPETEIGRQGQQLPFLAGRKNIRVYSGIPHKTAPQSEGTILKSSYGTQPMITRIEGQGNGGYFLEMTSESKNRLMSGGDNNSWTIGEIQYQNNYGPLGIKVIDPLRVQPFDYVIRFEEEHKDITDSTQWTMEILDATDQQIADLGILDTSGNPTRIIHSNMSIGMDNEQLILPLGISVSIANYPFQVHQRELWDFLMSAQGQLTGGFHTFQNISKYGQVDVVGSAITYENSDLPWLDGVRDVDGDLPDNWIRAGQQSAGQWEGLSSGTGVQDDYSRWKTEDFFILMGRGTLNDNFSSRAWKDPQSQFENLINKTWAPYVLSSPYYGGPQAKYIVPDNDYGATTEPQPAYYNHTNYNGVPFNPGFNPTLTNLYSVDVVFTPNKDLWTRCVVLEACDDATQSIGGALKNEPRKSASVDKNGNPDGTGTGMGWFPGYAINLETGERLNIMFSENSADVGNNGHDMLFNPTDVHSYVTVPNGTGGDTTIAINAEQYNTYFAENRSTVGQPVWGGKHFIYVCGSSGNTASTYFRYTNSERNFNDNGRTVSSNGETHGGSIRYNNQDYPYYDCPPYDEGRWLMAKFSTFVNNSQGVNSPYVHQLKMQLFNNVMWTSIPMPAYGQKENWLSNEATVKIRVSRPYMRYASRWYEDPAAAPYASQNGGYPMYTFTTKNIAPVLQAQAIHDNILEEINIVPNPYYGFSMYESTALETYVKIVNLPERCNISIFTVNGILVKRITKGDAGTTSVTWDLKNDAGIPIAGGMYIIHINAPGIGERALKFFCAMRPSDLNAF